MTKLGPLIRDPLIHFLAAGALLFAIFHLVHGPDRGEANEGRTIVVDRPSLLSFMQYEANAFEPKYFSTQFDALSVRDKQNLIDKYVREEALYREAKAMGLGEGDYVMRRRMIQKMMYLIDDMASESFAPDEAALRHYFLSHREHYMAAPSLTFTHVFVDREIKRKESSEEIALRLKDELQSGTVRFDQAPRYGDRFPFLQNYVERTPEYVESQFGKSFAAQLMTLEPSGAWQGPLQSDYGDHLILLTQRVAAHLPDFSEVKNQVRDDLLRDTIAARRDKTLTELTQTYQIKLSGISFERSAKTLANVSQNAN